MLSEPLPRDSEVFLTQHGEGTFGGSERAVDVFLGVVESNRITRGSGDAEGDHERLAAMMSGAHGYVHLVQQGTKVVVMDVRQMD